MEKETFEDTLQCITDHYEEELGKSTTEYNDLVNSYNNLIDKNEELFLKCSELVTEKNEKQRRIKRKAKYFLNENEKDITFVKQFPNGWLKLIRMVKEEKITYFDLGMFAALGAFLDQDTGIIMDMEGKALNKLLTRTSLVGIIPHRHCREKGTDIPTRFCELNRQTAMGLKT